VLSCSLVSDGVEVEASGLCSPEIVLPPTDVKVTQLEDVSLKCVSVEALLETFSFPSSECGISSTDVVLETLPTTEWVPCAVLSSLS